jgi:tRNA(Ile2) C34 agmatinyltransferase TiaS
MNDEEDLKRIIVTYCPFCGGDSIAALQGQFICTDCNARWDISSTTDEEE